MGGGVLDALPGGLLDALDAIPADLLVSRLCPSEWLESEALSQAIGESAPSSSSCRFSEFRLRLKCVLFAVPRLLSDCALWRKYILLRKGPFVEALEVAEDLIEVDMIVWGRGRLKAVLVDL